MREVTFSGCGKVLAPPPGDRGSHSLSVLSQLPVTTVFVSGLYSTHLIGLSWWPITISETNATGNRRCETYTHWECLFSPDRLFGVRFGSISYNSVASKDSNKALVSVKAMQHHVINS